MLDEGIYTLLDASLSSLRRQLPRNSQPGYEICDNNRLLFLELDLFFVKVNITPVFLGNLLLTLLGFRVYVHCLKLSTPTWS
jgi:hypothetical protein